jgi:hypothetical protein
MVYVAFYINLFTLVRSIDRKRLHANWSSFQDNTAFREHFQLSANCTVSDLRCWLDELHAWNRNPWWNRGSRRMHLRIGRPLENLCACEIYIDYFVSVSVSVSFSVSVFASVAATVSTSASCISALSDISSFAFLSHFAYRRQTAVRMSGCDVQRPAICVNVGLYL